MQPSPLGVQSDMGASLVHSALPSSQREPTPPSRATHSVHETCTERVHGRCRGLEGPREPEGKGAGHQRPRIAGFHLKGGSGTRKRRDRDARQPEAGAETVGIRAVTADRAGGFFWGDEDAVESGSGAGSQPCLCQESPDTHPRRESAPQDANSSSVKLACEVEEEKGEETKT